MTANPMPPMTPIGSMSATGASAPASKFKPVDPMRVARQHALLLIGSGVAGLVLGAGVFLGLRQFAPKWTSEAQLLAEFRDPTAAVEGSIRGDSRDLELFMASQTSRIKSDQILQGALQREDLIGNTQWFKNIQELNRGINNSSQVNALRSAIQVTPAKGTQLISLKATAANPSDAPLILNAVIETYLQSIKTDAAYLSGTEYEQLTRKKSELTTQISQLRNELEQLVAANEVPDSLRETIEFSNVVNLTNLLNEKEEFLRGSMSSTESMLQQLQEGTLEPTPSDVLVVEADPRVRALDSEIDLIEKALEANRTYYGPLHNTTKSTQRQLEGTKIRRESVFNELMTKVLIAKATEAQNAVDGLKAQVAELKAQNETAIQQMYDKQTLIDRRRSLQAQIRNSQEQLNLVDYNLEETARKGEREVLGGGKTVRAYNAPQKSKMTSPQIVLVPLGGIALSGLTFGLLMLRELMDQRVRSPQDLAAIPQADILGVIPDGSEDPSGNNTLERAVDNAPTSLLAESFRQTRTSLLGKMDRRGYKSVVLCAAQGGSGSSAITQNLAASLALNTRKVLVIDANFRRPRQHELFGVPNQAGLVDYLQGQRQDLEGLIQTHEASSVDILPTGPLEQAAPELLERQTFRQLLMDLESRYDMILIDTAPALLTSEASLLVKYADSVIGVVRANVDQRGMIERLTNKLDGQRADLLGVILNGVKSSAGGYFRKNYEDFYRYSNTSVSS